MSPLLFPLLCAASIVPVEAPRPDENAIEVTIRLADGGEVLFAPTIRTQSGRAAGIRIDDREVRVLPTRQRDGRIHFEIAFREEQPRGASVRTQRRMNATVTARNGSTIEFDRERVRIVIEEPGRPRTIVPLDRSR